MSIKVNMWYPQDEMAAKNRFAAKLVKKFTDEHDIDAIEFVTVNRFMSSANGIKTVINWLNSLGWKVKFWEIGPDEDGKTVAFGFDFDETCQMYIAERLKFDEN